MGQCHYCQVNDGHRTDCPVYVPSVHDKFSSPKDTEVSELKPKSISDWVKDCFENSVNHGFHVDFFHNKHVRNLFIVEKLCLIHSEVSECLEDVRDGNMEETTQIAFGRFKPIGFPSELADIVIRCFDLAGMLQIDLEGAIQRKHEYNKTRPFKHGKKF